MKILVTGAAGFIGYHFSKLMLENGHEVLGLDNINDYYSVQLKYDRLNDLGIIQEDCKVYASNSISRKNPNFRFVNLNLEDRTLLPKVFAENNFDKVVNLAAQAGVRYSIENPAAYIDSNIVGFANLLECCRNYKVKHLVYASSSSVYGQNEKIPFSVNDSVDHPISMYAATKKSNELMAYTYSHLFGFNVTGLRFFTVYGPWGRPDMAMFLFTDAIIKGEPVKIFNHGNLERDFTYIDDISDGIHRVVEFNNQKEKYTLYNIGNSKPVKLMNFIEEIEKQLSVKAKKEFLEMQPGDVYKTWADSSALKKDFGYNPSTEIEIGVKRFIDWYKSYYGKCEII